MKPGVPSAEAGHRRGQRRQRGFALLIMLVLAVMGSLFAVTGQLEFVTRKYARQDATFKALTLAKEALLGYALTYRDDPNHASEVFGYLPCPDTTAGDGAAAASCGTAGQAAIGLFPYKTLGLPDLRDSDGVCLWYAVSGNFKNNPKAINTSPAPDPLILMNWDTQGQFIIAGTPVAPEQGDGGAAAVIFAAGKPLAAQSRTVSGSSACQIALNQVTAYLDGNYNFATGSAITITPGTSDSTVNNDQLAWITPKEIFDKVVKRQDFSNALTASPPGQINTLTDIIQSVLEKKIQDDLTNLTNTSQPLTTGFTQAGKQIGRLPTTAASLQATPLYDNYTANKIDYSNYYNNWYDQYRLATCNSLTTPCLTVGGTLCRGALMFAGRTASGQPRTSAQKLYASIPQGTTNLASYFEAGSGLDLLNSSATTFSGSSAYSAASPSLDLGTCLVPGTFLSSAQDIAGFAGGLVTPSGTSPVASVTAGATPSINLGSATLVARSGCVWYQTPFALGSTLRLYFNFVIATPGQGFTLALASAATNNVASTNPYMCGSASASRLGYAGTPTGGTSVGIKPPKIGVEFDMAYTAARNDYNGDHFAFLFWGASGDDSPTGTVTGNDDNTHYNGILGSGSEPVNPYGLTVTTASATPIATFSAASWAGGTVSATTSAPHGFTTGQYALISDVTATGFDSTTPLAVTVSDATHFSYPLAADPGTYTYGTTASRTAKISALSCTSGTVTITTTTNHGFALNQYVNLSGIVSVGYNGTYPINTVVGLTSFKYSVGATCPSPSTYTANTGYATATNDVVSASWASGTVTVTTVANHGLGYQISGTTWSSATNRATVTTSANHNYYVGQSVTIASSLTTCNGSHAIVAVTATTFDYSQASDPGNCTGWVSAGETLNISGIYPAGYNGTYAVTVTSATQFTYALASNPGGSFNNTAFATSGFSTVKSPYFPAGGVLPTSPSTIHVRLDLTRSYSASAKQATFTLKAYMDNLFPVASVCSSSDFQNLARDLSAWCPLRTPTIEQDGVVINDVSGPAMANIYIGFTTARSALVGDNQNISIYNVLLRSQ